MFKIGDKVNYVTGHNVKLKGCIVEFDVDNADMVNVEFYTYDGLLTHKVHTSNLIKVED